MQAIAPQLCPSGPKAAFFGLEVSLLVPCDPLGLVPRGQITLGALRSYLKLNFWYHCNTNI